MRHIKFCKFVHLYIFFFHSFIYLFGVFHPTWEFFTHLEITHSYLKLGYYLQLCRSTLIHFLSLSYKYKNLKQEAHGPHCSPENQFQSVNKLAKSYVYTTLWLKRKEVKIDHYLLFENMNDICTNLKPLYARII